jgi:hypothetical protein
MVAPDADMWLTEAANAAKELMDNGPYSLYQQETLDFEYNAIHRYDRCYPVIQKCCTGEGMSKVFLPIMYRITIEVYNGGATKSLVEDYFVHDGKPISTSPLYQGDEVYEEIFENRDPRLRQTILHPDDQAIYRYGNIDFDDIDIHVVQGMSGGQKSYTGYHIIKVFEPGCSSCILQLIIDACDHFAICRGLIELCRS